MKRYFLVHDRDMPTIKDHMPGLNYIDLTSHGEAGDQWNLVCLDFDHVSPKENWQALPSLLDTKTTLAASAVDHETLADIGLTGEETTMEAVAIFSGIHPALGL